MVWGGHFCGGEAIFGSSSKHMFNHLAKLCCVGPVGLLGALIVRT